VTGDLFEPASGGRRRRQAADSAPLADRMRPRTFEELVGQPQLFEPGSPLELMREGRHLSSMILWGPPGTGKTTIARLLADATGAPFVAFSAVLSGVKEVKETMARAALERQRSGRATILFVDEIHRFNRAQQDAFLAHVERGDIVLIGATTENPSFEVNSALLSRTRVVVLHELTEDDLRTLVRRALTDRERGLREAADITPEGLDVLVQNADGDARRALNTLEIAAAAARGRPIGPEDVRQALSRKHLRYDRAGEEHYNLISALHKSLRDSDPHAGLYWTARMLARAKIRSTSRAGSCGSRARTSATPIRRRCRSRSPRSRRITSSAAPRASWRSRSAPCISRRRRRATPCTRASARRWKRSRRPAACRRRS
jgi:putative ATPase